MRHGIRAFLGGMLSREKSLATGLVIGLFAWTLTRLVSGITESGTIEYATRVTRATLADGRAGSRIKVRLSNLSHNTAVTNLQASISDPTGKITFSDDVKDRACWFAPPAWGEEPDCKPYTTGFRFSAPMLVPGTHASFAINYTQAEGDAVRPVVRIKPDGATKVRLVEPGLETFLARHETGILLGLLAAAAVLFVVSVAAGFPEAESAPKKK
jgi:hypothetical protein